MTRMMPGQQSLNNFFRSVEFSYPQLAGQIGLDISTVGLYALGGEQSKGHAAAARIREATRELPEIHRRVLESALNDLGYPEGATAEMCNVPPDYNDPTCHPHSSIPCYLPKGHDSGDLGTCHTWQSPVRV